MAILFPAGFDPLLLLLANAAVYDHLHRRSETLISKTKPLQLKTGLKRPTERQNQAVTTDRAEKLLLPQRSVSPLSRVRTFRSLTVNQVFVQDSDVLLRRRCFSHNNGRFVLEDTIQWQLCPDIPDVLP